jgi:hypothetical protein
MLAAADQQDGRRPLQKPLWWCVPGNWVWVLLDSSLGCRGRSAAARCGDWAHFGHWSECLRQMRQVRLTGWGEGYELQAVLVRFFLQNHEVPLPPPLLE